MSPGTSHDLAHYAQERRRRVGRYLTLEDFFRDQTDVNSMVDRGEAGGFVGGAATGPRVMLYHGVFVQAANDIASMWEFYNQDPFAVMTDPIGQVRGDAYFGNPLYVEALVMKISSLGPIPASQRYGIGIGSPWPGVSLIGATAGAAEVDTDIHMSLRYQPTGDTWELVVVNKWTTSASAALTNNIVGQNTITRGGFDFAGAGFQVGMVIGGALAANFPANTTITNVAVGTLTVSNVSTAGWVNQNLTAWFKRRFVKNLGNTAAIMPNTSVVNIGAAGRWGLLYLPNRAIQVFMDGKMIGTFTDAADGGGSTPLADIYANRLTIGSTIKGAGAFNFAGSGGGAHSFVIAVYEFYTERFGAW